MQLTMSMFATQKDYWKARAELAEKTVEETAKELGCEPDNESMLERAHSLVQHGKVKIEYTDWFQPEIKPVRNGLYLLKHSRRSDCWHMGYWNGEGWYGAESANHGRCTDMDLLGGGRNHNAYYWRGLTQDSTVISFPQEAEELAIRGWTIEQQRYGKWFISRQAVIDDWKHDHKEAYGEDKEPDDETIETWFSEQISWIEVRAYGRQIERPYMLKFEEAWNEAMARDADYLFDCKPHEVEIVPKIVSVLHKGETD